MSPQREFKNVVDIYIRKNRAERDINFEELSPCDDEITSHEPHIEKVL
jgi:hypothetical protein